MKFWGPCMASRPSHEQPQYVDGCVDVSVPQCAITFCVGAQSNIIAPSPTVPSTSVAWTCANNFFKREISDLINILHLVYAMRRHLQVISTMESMQSIRSNVCARTVMTNYATISRCNLL